MNVAEQYGCLVFNDRAMKTRLPKEVYNSFKKSVAEGQPLKLSSANVIANAMKD